MFLLQVFAQHQYKCSISSLVAGPPLLRTDRARDKLWLFHPLWFPSSSTLTSNASWGTQQDPLFLPFSLPPHLRQLPAQPRLSQHPAPQCRQVQGQCWEDAFPALPSSPPQWWDGCCRPLCVAQALVRVSTRMAAFRSGSALPATHPCCGVWLGILWVESPPQVAWLEQSCSSWGALGSKPELPREDGCCWPLDLHADLSSGVPVLNPRSHDGPGWG